MDIANFNARRPLVCLLAGLLLTTATTAPDWAPAKGFWHRMSV